MRNVLLGSHWHLGGGVGVGKGREGEVGGMLVVPQRDSVSAGDRPKSGPASEQLLLSVPSWG